MLGLVVAGVWYVALQLATCLGFWLSGRGLLGGIAVAVLRVIGNQEIFYGQATAIISVLFLGGVQLIFLGILGEYLGRIYDEVKNRPFDIVREAPEQGVGAKREAGR